MIDPRLKELRGPSRRQFLRWSATVAACLGVERARYLNVISDSAGSAAADLAACASSMRSIHIIDGDGGLANWTQVFPFRQVIASTNAQYSHYALGQGTPGEGFDRPFTNAPDTPWQGDPRWRPSVFLCGNDETHTRIPNTAASLGPNSLLAATAAIQQSNPALLPVITVGTVQFGAAPGAPAVASVDAPAQLIELFNSTSSRALLATPTNGQLSEAYYSAFLGLNAAAGRTSVAKAHNTGKVSMKLLGQNLAAQLTPTVAEEELFGITAASPTRLQDMARAMITTVKAFTLGLTSSLMITGFRDDPHERFAGGNNQAAEYSRGIARMLNGLRELAKAKQDPACSSKTLADNLVLTIHGDTYKAPFARSGWADGSPMGSNVMYVMGGGHLKTGWFGDVTGPNDALGWDPTTGETSGAYSGRGTALGASAAAAVLYAVSKGDMRRVRDFYNGPAIDGVVNLNVTG